jgi:hypothetical protein
MGEIEFSYITKYKLDFALLFSLANSLHSDDVQDPRPNILPHELLLGNVPVANTPNQNTKKATASRAEQFEALFPLVKLYGTDWDSRDNRYREAVFLGAASTCTRVGHGRPLTSDLRPNWIRPTGFD